MDSKVTEKSSDGGLMEEEEDLSQVGAAAASTAALSPPAECAGMSAGMPEVQFEHEIHVDEAESLGALQGDPGGMVPECLEENMDPAETCHSVSTSFRGSLLDDANQESIMNARSLVHSAIEADQARDYARALSLYADAVRSLLHTLKVSQLTNAVRRALRAKASMYLSRAEKIKAFLSRQNPAFSSRHPESSNPGNSAEAETETDTARTSSPDHDASRFRMESPPQWEDVQGYAVAKEKLKEWVLLPLLFPQLFSGARRHHYPHVLIYGVPGVGKSFIARSIKSKAPHCSFFHVHACDFITRYTDGVRNLRSLMQLAEQNQPSIVIVDDIEMWFDVPRNRYSRLLAEFLHKMQELTTIGRNVSILCTSSMPWALTGAVRRRFQRRLYLQLPCCETRRAILQNHIESLIHDLDPLDLDEVAVRTDGYTASDLVCFMRGVSMASIRKIQQATHFRKVRNQMENSQYAPCLPGDPGSIALSWQDIPEDSLQMIPVTSEDLHAELRSSRPSISPVELDKMDEFHSNYGYDFEEPQTQSTKRKICSLEVLSAKLISSVIRQPAPAPANSRGEGEEFDARCSTPALSGDKTAGEGCSTPAMSETKTTDSGSSTSHTSGDKAAGEGCSTPAASGNKAEDAGSSMSHMPGDNAAGEGCLAPAVSGNKTEYAGPPTPTMYRHKAEDAKSSTPHTSKDKTAGEGCSIPAMSGDKTEDAESSTSHTPGDKAADEGCSTPAVSRGKVAGTGCLKSATSADKATADSRCLTPPISGGKPESLARHRGGMAQGEWESERSTGPSNGAHGTGFGKSVRSDNTVRGRLAESCREQGHLTEQSYMTDSGRLTESGGELGRLTGQSDTTLNGRLAESGVNVGRLTEQSDTTLNGRLAESGGNAGSFTGQSNTIVSGTGLESGGQTGSLKDHSDTTSTRPKERMDGESVDQAEQHTTHNAHIQNPPSKYDLIHELPLPRSLQILVMKMA